MSATGGAGSSAAAMGTDGAAFQAPPEELKFLSPYLQRAHETRKADPALSYWCNFYTAQLGMTRLSSLPASAKAFLINLMDVLESQKAELSDNDIVHGGDLVARAHVENVALKVFAGADNEDRAGKATRATARRFLVACNFIDVLTVFSPLEQDMMERQKYAKWKAADIAKALREGRKPTPGPAGGLEEDADSLADVPDATVAGINAASARMGGLDANPGPLPSKEELDAEMAKLALQEGGPSTVPMAISSDGEAFSEEGGGDRRTSTSSPTRSRRAESRLSIDGRDGLLDSRSNGSNPALNANSPNFSMPLRIGRQDSYASDEGTQASRPDTQSAFYHYTQGRVPSGGGGEHASGASSPYARPLPHPPASGGTLPITPRTSLPSHPNDADGQASSPFPSAPPSSFSAAAQATPSAPPAPLPVPAQPMSSAPPPSTLDLKQTARVQKLARWAVSALDYEDLDTARMHLREALDICEGRSTTMKM